MANPFFYGGRVIDQTHFVGREMELRRIFTGLETFVDGQAQHFSIVGPRRIGKSSLLYHVTKIYNKYLSHPEKYHFVYIDLDDPHCHTLSGLLHFILTSLNIAHPHKTTLEQFQESIERFRERTNHVPVICLDEFEHLTKRKTEFPNAVFETWRSMGSNSHVAFITASKITLDELIESGDLTSSFHNIFMIMQLGEFTKEGAEAFLEIGKTCDRPFTEYETEKILALASRHPAKLQVACDLLYQAKSAIPINWQKLESDFNKQIDFVLGKPKTNWSVLSSLKKLFHLIFVSIPRMLGRFLLDLFNRDKAQDSTASILGWIIIIALYALLIKLISWQEVVDLFKSIWLFFFPPKS